MCEIRASRHLDAIEVLPCYLFCTFCMIDDYYILIIKEMSVNKRKCWCQFNKLTSVFLCVCPVIDHKFRHHIVKVAVDPRGDSRVDPQTTLTM